MTRRSRLLLLLLAALASLLAIHVYTARRVRVETAVLRSNLTGRALEYGVLLPRGYGLITSRWKRYPVLYLLHGWNGHPSDWLNQTGLKEYAAEHELIIVMPEGGNSWYTDSATAPSEKYESYILQELIPDVEGRYRVVAGREGRAIAGLSMGGYGALKFGLKHPDQFALAASTSGALDAPARTDEASIMRTFGAADAPARAENDLFRLARDLPEGSLAALPYFYMDCGTEDAWLKTNRDLDSLMTGRKIPHEFRELPGSHDWRYWDARLQDILRVASERLAPAR